MAKTKPKSQNELTKETSGTNLFIWGPYRSQAHIRARNSKKLNKGNPPYTSGQHEKQKYINLALLRRHKVPKGNYIR